MEVRPIDRDRRHSDADDPAALQEAVRDLHDDSRILAKRLAALESIVWKLADRLQEPPRDPKSLD